MICDATSVLMSAAREMTSFGVSKANGPMPVGLWHSTHLP
jgi:hypothetical protein